MYIPTKWVDSTWKGFLENEKHLINYLVIIVIANLPNCAHQPINSTYHKTQKLTRSYTNLPLITTTEYPASAAPNKDCINATALGTWLSGKGQSYRRMISGNLEVIVKTLNQLL